jgi:uncharacterized membrane protein YedE/YeeE
MQTSWLYGLIGGAIIGIASALLLLAHGRIAGISGILGGTLQAGTPDRGWRLAFVAGLALAGLTAALAAPSLVAASPRPLVVVAVAGVLVGFGTRLGSGCTSGHGVCGIGRLSARSLVAVPTFIAAGVVTTWIARVL